MLNMSILSIYCKYCDILPDNFIDTYNNKNNLFLLFFVIIDAMWYTIYFI